MRAVIVAKTRMGQNICVGAVDELTGELRRLIPSDGQQYNSWQEFDAPVGSIVDLRGRQIEDLDPPHIEDYSVEHWGQIGEIDDLPSWIEQECDVWIGTPENLFGGLLQLSEGGSGYIKRTTGVPTQSVGFWKLPWSIFHREWRDEDRVTHRYVSAQRHGFKVKYVGLDEPIEVIPRGAIVRVSLARWHRIQGHPEEECWLQLSGWYLNDFDF